MDSAICGGSSAESRCVASDGGSIEGISAMVDDGCFFDVGFEIDADVGGGEEDVWISWLFCVNVQGSCEGEVAV
jgi:hypothetical protein